MPVVEPAGAWLAPAPRVTSCQRPREVSYSNATLVHEDLMAALEPGVTTVIVDLTLTTFFDSAGLSKTAVGRRPATACHIDLRVVVPWSSPVAGFFASSGSDRVLAIYPTLLTNVIALPQPRMARASRAAG